MTTALADLKKHDDATAMRDIRALPQPKQFPAMLEAFKGEIARALPAHMNPDRMARIALTEFRKNPKLAQCQPASVFAAIIQGSQLGLEPGLLGQAYLIPYKEECQLIPGYQGLLDLVRRSGLVQKIEAHVVYTKDKFTYKAGLNTTLDHEPYLDGDRGERRLAYAVAEFRDGGSHVEVMTRQQIEKIRDGSQNVRNAAKYNKETPWDTATDEMWRKTVLRRICKFLPKSAELATALALDDAASRGPQDIAIKDAIEGSWMPVVNPPDEDGVIPDAGKAAEESTFAEAIGAVRQGDYDLARDLARGLQDGQRQQIEVAIGNREKEAAAADGPATKEPARAKSLRQSEME